MFDPTKVKPKLYSLELCKLMKIAQKPHFKCYFLRKYNSLSYSEKMNLTNYFRKIKHENNLRIYLYNNYPITKWQLTLFLDHCVIQNKEKIIEKSINYKLNFSDDQIYMKLLNLKDDTLQLK